MGNAGVDVFAYSFRTEELKEFVVPLRVVAGDIVCYYSRDKRSVEGRREFILEEAGHLCEDMMH